MSRRPTALLIALLVCVGACKRSQPEPTGTDLILVTIDTLRRDRLGTFGYARDTDPRLRALSQSSIVFDQAIANHTHTGPAHASLLSGLYPQQHGILRNGLQVRDEVPLLQGLLSARGWVTGAFVSGGTLSARLTGLGRGFSTFDDAFAAERPGRATLVSATRWLATQLDDPAPVFLWLHLFEPHFPYAPTPQRAARFGGETASAAARRAPRRPLPRVDFGAAPADAEAWPDLYDAEVSEADRVIGTLLDGLQRRGRLEGALVMVVADHGETLAERGWPFDHGSRLYDEQVRVPLLIRLPKGHNGGRRTDLQVEQIDLLPTVCDLLGVPAPAALPGRSLRPLLEGKGDALPPRPAFSLARLDRKRVPEVAAPLPARGYLLSVRQPPFKLVRYSGTTGPVVQLFDLQADPGERVDVAERVPEARAMLESTLAAFEDRVGIVGTGADDASPAMPDSERETLRALGYVE